MPYSIGYAPQVTKQIRQLNRSIQARIVSKLGDLANTPRPSGCVKIAGSNDLWRIRIGDYRVIYAVDDDDRHIEVHIVAHRRESYRGL